MITDDSTKTSYRKTLKGSKRRVVTLTAFVTQDTKEKFCAIAESEHRTVSAMLEIVVNDFLKERLSKSNAIAGAL